MDSHDNLQEFTDPANYDLEQGPLAQERIAFWCRMAAQFGGPVLELCCGTGLVAIPVAAMGLSVTGVDLAAPMLAHAQAKAGLADVDVHWIEADARALVLPRRFGFVILTGNAFQAFLTPADQRALLATVRRQLAPEGVFGFETRNPAGFALDDEPEGPTEIDYVDVAGRRVRLSSSQRWDAATQIVQWTTFRRWADADGTPRVRTTRIACRFTSPAEIEDRLDAAGFEIVAQYGDWNFAPFRASGERLITLCRRRAGA
ncbi:MAG: class I SAM-dependent methyltransferase [Burkholderiales bacterium]|nr:class I SAM-dependent methyltransferase [Burkholderiales bacterium]